MAPAHPSCTCLQCKSHALMYSSIFDMHRCLECEIEIQNSIIEGVVSAFAYKNKEPYIVGGYYDSIECVGCLSKGGIYFEEFTSFNLVTCKECNYSLYFRYYINAKINVERTKIIETTYNCKFTIFERK